jgi:hypothetical protein
VKPLATQCAKYAAIWIGLNVTVGVAGGVAYAAVTHPLNLQPWAHLLAHLWGLL